MQINILFIVSETFKMVLKNHEFLWILFSIFENKIVGKSVLSGVQNGQQAVNFVQITSIIICGVFFTLLNLQTEHELKKITKKTKESNIQFKWWIMNIYSTVHFY